MQRYLVDGYNLLFQTAWVHQSESLEKARKQLIEELDSIACQFNLSITLVFDAPLQSNTLSRRHFRSLEIIFTAKGQTADAFLIQWLETLVPNSTLVVVTSDKALARHARSFGVKVEPVKDFLAWLKKKKQKKAPDKKVTIKKEPSVQKNILKNKNQELPALGDLVAWEKLFTEQLFSD